MLGTATRAAAVEPGWAEGQWIGGFEGVDGTVYISAQVEAEAGVLTGSLELPLQSDGAVRAREGQGHRGRAPLRRPRARRRASPSTASAARPAASPARSARAAAPPASSCSRSPRCPTARLDAIAGTYELEPGHNVLVARSQGGLIYVDQDRGRVGALFALDDRTLVGGPSLGSGYPIELKIEVPAAPGEAVDRIKWSWRGRDTALGVRRHPYRAETVGFASSGAVQLWPARCCCRTAPARTPPW